MKVFRINYFDEQGNQESSTGDYATVAQVLDRLRNPLQLLQRRLPCGAKIEIVCCEKSEGAPSPQSEQRERSVSIAGSAAGTTIITGDNSVVLRRD